MKTASRESCKRADQASNQWLVDAPADHELADVLRPEYLGVIVRELEAGAIVAIRHAEHYFIARIYIEAVDLDLRAVVYHPLEIIDLRMLPKVAPDYQGFTVGRRNGTVVVLRPDGVPLRKTFASEKEASEWLAAKRLLGMATTGGAD